MTLAGQVIEKWALFDTLLSLEEPVGTFPVKVLFELAGAAGEYKVFWEHVPSNVEMPYIVISHMTGGRGVGVASNQTYSHTWWKIVCHTADQSFSEQAANTIALLQGVCPITTHFSGVTAVQSLQESMPVFDRYSVQNTPQFIVGGIYEMYLNLGSN